MFVILIVVIGFSIAFSFVAEYLDLVWPAVNVLLVFIYQAGYAITHVSLLLCLFAVITTLLWYPYVRKKFSSPAKRTGASVLKVVLAPFIIVMIVHIPVLLISQHLGNMLI